LVEIIFLTYFLTIFCLKLKRSCTCLINKQCFLLVKLMKKYY
jgi:hypothetical protein